MPGSYIYEPAVLFKRKKIFSCLGIDLDCRVRANFFQPCRIGIIMPVEIGIISSIVLWNYIEFVCSQLFPSHIELRCFGLIGNAVLYTVISRLFNTFTKRVPINLFTAPAGTKEF